MIGSYPVLLLLGAEMRDKLRHAEKLSKPDFSDN